MHRHETVELQRADSRTRSPALVYRHTLVVRMTHWISALCLLLLAMSGFQIFNAHPALYWGDRSERPILTLASRTVPTGSLPGLTIFGHRVHGVSVSSGFPGWATIPSTQSLAMGRRWHFFFAWILAITGLVFVLASVLDGHLARDVVPSRLDWQRLPSSIRQHLTLHRPADWRQRYNVLQKVTDTLVILALGPLVVLSGLAMSPALDAAFPWLPVAFGGRQSARTVHFLLTFAFLLFTVVHVVMITATGPIDNLRAMITGWMRSPTEP